MVKNDICLGDASKQNALFSENVPQKTHPCPHFLEFNTSLIPNNNNILHKISRFLAMFFKEKIFPRNSQ